MTDASDQLPQEVLNAIARRNLAAAALQQGNKIDAIRLLRAETGIRLKEAKDLVGATARQVSPETITLSPGEAPRLRSGTYWLVVALTIILGVGLYLLFHRTP